MRKLSRREVTLLVLLGAGLLALGIRFFRRESQALVAVQTTARAASLPAIPRIDLARLDAPREAGQAGRRNLFSFGAAPQEREEEPPLIVPTPRPTALSAQPPGGMPGDSPPNLPPLNLKYVGSVENTKGLKVAVLITDRREVLTGQQGQVVANRYRIRSIGFESVDIEDVNTGQPRRIPLRGE